VRTGQHWLLQRCFEDPCNCQGRCFQIQRVNLKTSFRMYECENCTLGCGLGQTFFWHSNVDPLKMGCMMLSLNLCVVVCCFVDLIKLISMP
jgi:hypothetical protein